MSDLASLLTLAAADTDGPAADATTSAIADAALHEFELFGIARSTMEQIARRAKVGRVTLYRRFPGRDALVEAVVLRELQRFLTDLDSVTQQHEAAEDKLVNGFVFTLEAIRSHRLLQRLLESEPETLLPYLTVHGAPFIGGARDFLAARLAVERPDNRSPEEFVVVADVVVRLLLSFLLTPQTPLDLDDPDVARAFALRYLQPLVNGPS